MSQTLNIPVIPYSEWLAQLEALTTSSKGDEPAAAALLQFYRKIDLSAMKITARMACEHALRAARPLTEEDIDSWLFYLKDISFI